jgi:adenylosuccinate synthase
LVAKGITPPKVYAHSECLVTHIEDILNGRKREILNNHGSCGMGIHQTIVRSVDSFKYRYYNIRLDPKQFNDNVCKYYYISDFYNDFYKKYLDDLYFMNEHIEIVNNFQDSDFFKNYDEVIFEGAQGLQLSEDAPNFPHVTHSFTGMKNIKHMLKCFDSVEVCYVSRCYQTRHGNGPLDHEMSISEWFDIVDETNLPNEWQGSMRFAPLNVSKLIMAISSDIYNHGTSNKNIKYTFAMTCIDQINDIDTSKIPVIYGNNVVHVNGITLLLDIKNILSSLSVGFKYEFDNITNG